MNREQIIGMAREAGFTEGDISLFPDLIAHFATIIAAAERSACARVCEDAISSIQVGKNVCTNLAAAIRARGEK